jgi:hypothetical protein
MLSPFQKPTPWHPILFYSSAKPHGTVYARFSTFSTRLSKRRDLNVQGEPKTLKTELFYTAMASVCVMAWPYVPMKDTAYLQTLSAVCIRVSLDLACHKQLCSGRCNLLCTGDKLLL